MILSLAKGQEPKDLHHKMNDLDYALVVNAMEKKLLLLREKHLGLDLRCHQLDTMTTLVMSADKKKQKQQIARKLSAVVNDMKAMKKRRLVTKEDIILDETQLTTPTKTIAKPTAATIKKERVKKAGERSRGDKDLFKKNRRSEATSPTGSTPFIDSYVADDEDNNNNTNSGASYYEEAIQINIGNKPIDSAYFEDELQNESTVLEVLPESPLNNTQSVSQNSSDVVSSKNQLLEPTCLNRLKSSDEIIDCTFTKTPDHIIDSIDSSNTNFDNSTLSSKNKVTPTRDLDNAGIGQMNLQPTSSVPESKIVQEKKDNVDDLDSSIVYTAWPEASINQSEEVIEVNTVEEPIHFNSLESEEQNVHCSTTAAVVDSRVPTKGKRGKKKKSASTSNHQISKVKKASTRKSKDVKETVPLPKQLKNSSKTEIANTIKIDTVPVKSKANKAVVKKLRSSYAHKDSASSQSKSLFASFVNNGKFTIPKLKK